jgi:hypothetical protein
MTRGRGCDIIVDRPVLLAPPDRGRESRSVTNRKVLVGLCSSACGKRCGASMALRLQDVFPQRRHDQWGKARTQATRQIMSKLNNHCPKQAPQHGQNTASIAFPTYYMIRECPDDSWYICLPLKLCNTGTAGSQPGVSCMISTLPKTPAIDMTGSGPSSS